MRLLVMNLAALLLGGNCAAQDVLTANYDRQRTSAALHESVLTPFAVSSSAFQKLFAMPVDGAVYAQPLYMRHVSLPNGHRPNVVFAATAHNSVYAFDADKPGRPLWSVNLGPSIPASAFGDFTDVYPEVGILGTPVIDEASNTLYVVAPGFSAGAARYELHALDIASGLERAGSPVLISGQIAGSGAEASNGSIPFVPLQHMQRTGLLLLNGIVYIGFGSHADAPPYHGWLFAYDATALSSPPIIFNTTPAGDGGAFWQAGRAPAADSASHIYVVSSNGDTDERTNYSDSVLRLDAASLNILDWFSPDNVQYLNDNDEDLGSSGAVLIPGTKLLVTGGKGGSLYLLNSGSLGKKSAGNSRILQSLSIAQYGIFNMALWNRTGGPLLFVPSNNEPIQSFELSGNALTAASQSPSPFGNPYSGITVSADGGQPGTGVVWVTTTDGYDPNSPGTLHAFNAEDLSQELWNSSKNPADALGVFNKFTNPTVANGKVYAATGSDEIVVYGLQTVDSSGAPLIDNIVNAASNLAGPVAPGEMISLFGQHLGRTPGASGAFDSNAHLGGELGGTVVTFNGVPAPLLYASATQLNLVVPFETDGLSSVEVQVDHNGQLSSAQNWPLAATAPGIFSVLNQDWTLNSAASPAAAGSYITLYATGGGQTSPADETGFAAQGASPVAAAATVMIGGVPAAITYAGNAPQQLNGLLQINVQVPATLAGAGTAPIVLTIGGVQSPQPIGIFIQ